MHIIFFDLGTDHFNIYSTHLNPGVLQLNYY